MKVWSAQGVFPVVGVHPKKMVDKEKLSKLAALLELPEVVGLGEIGLDRKAPVEKRAEQLSKFERVLMLLKTEHILVLHCRSLTS